MAMRGACDGSRSGCSLIAIRRAGIAGGNDDRLPLHVCLSGQTLN